MVILSIATSLCAKVPSERRTQPNLSFPNGTILKSQLFVATPIAHIPVREQTVTIWMFPLEICGKDRQ